MKWNPKQGPSAATRKGSFYETTTFRRRDVLWSVGSLGLRAYPDGPAIRELDRRSNRKRGSVAHAQHHHARQPDEIEDGSPDKAWIHIPLFSATVAAWDLQGVPYPVMAEAVPKLNTDSWRVFPDGRMETTFRLRPGLTWHDGTPLTAEDFVFGHRVTRMRSEWGAITPPVGFQAIDEMLAPDARTLLIRWRQPFLEAPAPPCDGACLLLPFPRHILEGPLSEGQPNAFGAHPFWTTEYVGAAPFRLNRYEQGAFIEHGAFDGYALGRPKINRIRLTWGGGDANVAVARLLAGDADLVLDGALRFEQASTLRQQWGQQNTVLLSPLSLRYVQAQARPDWVSPQSLLDVRVRKAILHAIDHSRRYVRRWSMTGAWQPTRFRHRRFPTIRRWSASSRNTRTIPDAQSS